MNSIIITAIICVTILVAICIVCYANYKARNNDCLARINNKFHDILTHLDSIDSDARYHDRYLESISEKLNEIKNQVCPK